MIKMKKRKFIALIVGVVIATLLAATGGLYLYGNINNMALIKKTDYDTMTTITNKYAKLYEIQETINKKGLWKVDQEKQMEAIYRGLVGSMDDRYSEYMNEEEVKAWSNAVNGTFIGIGVVFTENKDGNLIITSVVDGSPASSAGLRKDDVILKVDGKEFKDAEKAKTAMRGKEGTKVAVTYKRGNTTKTVSMVRAEVEDRSVGSAVLDGKIGYIRIKAFEKATSKQFKTELADMESRNVKGLIIDIRNNGGGLIDSGIDIADMLLPECRITYMEDNNGKKTNYNSDGEATKLPYVLLVNENTASTSEILTAAIKDNKGGKIVGTTTFGKGIVQGTVSFNDGTALKLTVMQFFSPNGQEIHKKGITPDYKVSLKATDKEDKQLKKALALLK